MARHRLGSVPYVNAAPLIGRFLLEEGLAVQVAADVPSRLPALLDAGEVDSILVSSVESLRRAGAKVARGVGIISRGRVESVRLFAKKPWPEVRTLALDASSMTSSLLAQILLREIHGASPQTVIHPPRLEEMLDAADACLLIGDIGMDADGSGLHVMDMGEAWTSLTGLPFVWALWLGQITPALSHDLREALDWSGLGADRPPSDPTGHEGEVVSLASHQSGWPREKAARYLTETMHYRLDEAAWEGLSSYRELLETHRLASGLALPERV